MASAFGRLADRLPAPAMDGQKCGPMIGVATYRHLQLGVKSLKDQPTHE